MTLKQAYCYLDAWRWVSRVIARFLLYYLGTLIPLSFPLSPHFQFSARRFEICSARSSRKVGSVQQDQIKLKQLTRWLGILNDPPISESPSTLYDENDHISVKEESKYDSASVQTSESDVETFKNGSDSEQADNFDWEDEDPVEDRLCDGKEFRGRRSCFLCLDRRSSLGSWIIYIILTLISVGVCVGVFIAVHPGDSDPTMTSYNLCLWFTFIAFMFCISFVMQCVIELFPFALKKIVETFYPTRSEYLRSRLSVMCLASICLVVD